MDKKMWAVLAVAVVGLVAGVAGIVVANNAKTNNQDTQAQLDAAVSKENKRVVALAAAAKVQIEKSGKADEASLQSAEGADKAATLKDSDQIASFQSTLNNLTSQISALESAQKDSTEKLNARIDDLSSRVGG